MIPLLYGKNGELVEVVKLVGGKSFIDKLASMGIYSGTKLKIIRDGDYGAMILGVGNTRIGIGRGMAQKILVRPVRSTLEVK